MGADSALPFDGVVVSSVPTRDFWRPTVRELLVYSTYQLEETTMAQRDKPQQTDPATIEEHLEGLSYPATKQELMRHAESQNAPQEVMTVLEHVDDREYGSPAEVSQNVGEQDQQGRKRQKGHRGQEKSQRGQRSPGQQQ